ncbi:beta-prism lectin domain-containing protein [Vibrio jasicida]|uniref:beta-prism lectin domain-containing protein n=1 Tax=Vibrio jasicida TaxID=766224 RepID=UPI000696C0CD|nr:beta-prism lectin domain-containing protein [Vibrio jasicida]
MHKISVLPLVMAISFSAVFQASPSLAYSAVSSESYVFNKPHIVHVNVFDTELKTPVLDGEYEVLVKILKSEKSKQIGYKNITCTFVNGSCEIPISNEDLKGNNTLTDLGDSHFLIEIPEILSNYSIEYEVKAVLFARVAENAVGFITPTEVDTNAIYIDGNMVIDSSGRWVGDLEGLGGEVGPQGPKGDKGDKGDKGTAGAQGPKGNTGPKGAKGEAGAVGPVGPKGDKGAKGDRGTAGAQGPKGNTGPKGAKGDAGAVGPVGPKGDKGDKGAKGAKGDKGTAGAQGPRGHTGAKGEAGAVGPVGPKGDKGDKGAKGDRGTAGAQGPRGATGPKGAIGPKGNTGARGATGAKGNTGSRGYRGYKGEEGDSAYEVWRKLPGNAKKTEEDFFKYIASLIDIEKDSSGWNSSPWFGDQVGNAKSMELSNNKLFIRSGWAVDAIGSSSSNYVGLSSGGRVYNVSTTNLKQINVTVGNYRYAQGKRSIVSLEFVYKNGSRHKYGTGQESTNKQVSTYSIPNGKTLKKIEAYSPSRYIVSAIKFHSK